MASQSTLSFSSEIETDLAVAIGPSAPAELLWKSLRWTRIDHVANQGKGSKTSPIWGLGEEYVAMEDPNQRAWRCQLCPGNKMIGIPQKRSGPAIRHLRDIHPGVLNEKSIDELSDVASITTNESRPDRFAFGLLQRVDIEKFRHHLLRWIVRNQLAFTTVEDEDFRQLLLALSCNVEKYLVHKSTIRNWAEIEFDRSHLIIKQLLATAKSKIHISFDLWTSPNAYAICAICSHFVGSNDRNSSVMLGMKRMRGPHTGENIAEVMIPVLEHYEIISKLGVFVADNVDVNDSAIRATLLALRPDLDIRTQRSRCLGHIINLAVKAFLFGRDVTAFEQAVEVDEESEHPNSERMKAAQLEWRKKGAVGKFHNVALFIRSSPQRREAFKKCLVSDNEDGK